jgi:hypothetical protein
MKRNIILTILVILLAVGALFWRQVWTNPRNVFSAMIENSLSTRSVAKVTIQDSGPQSLVQRLQLQSGQNNIANSRTTLSQNNGGQTAKVDTESIGTPSEDYVRYLKIETNQKNDKGKALDFSQIIGQWGRSQRPSQITTSGELYGEAVLGIVPFGFVPAVQRDSLIRMINEKDIYKIDYSKVQRKIVNGRHIFVYEVEIAPENYVTLLKEFARNQGLSQLESFDPASFKNSPALKAKLSVDILSRQLVKAEFTDSNRLEEYSGYGANFNVVIPRDTIPVEELQQRLQSVQ